MILGHGRTGTTILHEVMSTDPQFRIVKRWEAMFPCPPPEEASYDTDPRIERADKLITIFDRVTPEWKAMHKFGGDLPVECAEYLYACFLSNVFVFSFQIPSYAAYIQEQDVGLHDPLAPTDPEAPPVEIQEGPLAAQESALDRPHPTRARIPTPTPRSS